MTPSSQAVQSAVGATSSRALPLSTLRQTMDMLSVLLPCRGPIGGRYPSSVSAANKPLPSAVLHPSHANEGCDLGNGVSDQAQGKEVSGKAAKEIGPKTKAAADCVQVALRGREKEAELDLALVSDLKPVNDARQGAGPSSFALTTGACSMRGTLKLLKLILPSPRDRVVD